MSIFSPDNYFFNIHALPLFAVGALILLSGIFVFYKMRGNRVALTFLIMSLSGSIWFLCTAMGYLSQVPEVGLFWFKIDNIGVVFLSSTVYSFVVAFLGLYDKRKYYVISGYLISTIFALLILTTNWMDTGVQTFFWGYFPKWGFLSRIFFPFFFVYMIFSFVELFARLRTEDNQKIKNQIIYFLLAFGAAYTSSIDYFATFGISIYPASFISMGAYFIIIAYAITKHRLLNISLAISRTAAWIISASFLGVLYLILVMLYRTFIFPGVDTAFIALSVLYGIAAGVSFQNIRFFIQTGADKAFIKGWYDYRKVQRKITSELRRAFSIEEALKIIKMNLDEQVDVTRVSLLLPDNTGDYASAGMRIPDDSPIIKTIRENKDIVSRDDFSGLPDELCVPCFSMDQLSALIVLGKKRSEDSYNDQDYDLLETIGDEVSDSILRIKPYEEVKKEYEATQKKLYDTERLLAVSERIAAMARLIQEYNHEIRTPLAIMGVRISNLPDDASQIKNLKEEKEILMQQIKRATDIVDTTLRLSKPKEHKEEELDLNEIIEEALNLYQPIGANLTKELGALPKIKGDIDDLKLVFINLLKNAREAIADKGEIRIRTYTVEEDGHPTVCAEVTDNGSGIPKENMSKIFEPFFSTHITKGRGLGLSIVFRIVREHLGKIEVESEAGKGSLFRIKLPAR